MNDGDGPDLPEGPQGPEGPENADRTAGSDAGDRGHLRDGHLRDAQAGHLRDGHLRDGHLRDGHLRDGHLRDGLLTDVGALPTVPDLLATDALLDRLGRHEVTDGDLRDTVAKLLHGFALHADPETAGVRGLELPDVADLPAGDADGDLGAPRVLLARRRTIERLGRGTAAACAVLALFGGTAAVAATGSGDLAPQPAIAAAASASGTAPVFSVGGGILTWITGSTEDRAKSTLKRLTVQATDGSATQAVAAAAAARQLAVDLRASGAPTQLVAQAETFAATVQEAVDRGGDVGAALGTPSVPPPPGVTVVTPGAGSPTTSTLPLVISAGLRQIAGQVPYAPTSPTATPSTSPVPTSSAPGTTPPASSPAVVPTPARTEPAPSRPGGAPSASTTPAPSTPVPSTPVPTTPVPTTPVPTTPVPTTPVPTTPVPTSPTDPPTDSPTDTPVPTTQPAPPSTTSDPVVTPPPLVTTAPPTTPPTADPVPTAPPTDGTPSPTDGPPVSSQPTPSEVPVPTGVPTSPSDEVSATS